MAYVIISMLGQFQTDMSLLQVLAGINYITRISPSTWGKPIQGENGVNNLVKINPIIDHMLIPNQPLLPIVSTLCSDLFILGAAVSKVIVELLWTHLLVFLLLFMLVQGLEK